MFTTMDEQEHVEVLNSVIRYIIDEIVEEVRYEIQIEQNRKPRLWVRKWIARRDEFGASQTLFQELAEEDQNEYFFALRMSEESFECLLSKVEPIIRKKDTLMRCALSPKLKLHIVLYFLATGNSYRSLSHFFRVSKSSISQMLPDVCEAIYDALKDFIKVPENLERWKAIESGFRSKWNFPACCGALDGKHVVLKAPPEAGSMYYNYKHTNSLVLMALVDDDYCFSYIDVGCNGRISDGGVFRNCSLSTALENNLLPENHLIVADNASPLKPYIMKPYPGNNLTLKEKVFNYRLSRARRIVENAFGILVGRFRIFKRPIPITPDKVDKVVKACCALQNWLRKTKRNNVNAPTVDFEDTRNGCIVPGSWRQVPSDGLVDLPRTLQNHSSRDARMIRDNYADYFDEGSVNWQCRMIH